MTQASLLDWHAPSQPTPTSEAAARAIAPHAGTLRALVLDWLRAHGPSTDETLGEAVPAHKSGTIRARRIELTHAAMVRDTGRTVATRARRQATLWTAT